MPEEKLSFLQSEMAPTGETERPTSENTDFRIWHQLAESSFYSNLILLSARIKQRPFKVLSNYRTASDSSFLSIHGSILEEN